MSAFLFILAWSIAISRIRATTDDPSSETVTIYSSCNFIEQDGLYYIKPADDLPVFAALCSNGYAMLDGSLDLSMTVFPSLITSYDYGRDTQRFFSRMDDLSTFREWWLPADEATKFRVAAACNTCESGEFDDNTVYYTDSNSFCFSDLTRSGCIDDTTSYYYHEESCHQCDSGTFDDDGAWGTCHAVHVDADHPIVHNHIECVAHGLTFRPVVSNLRDSCTCYQPAETEAISYEIAVADLPMISWTATQAQEYGVAYIADYMQFTPVVGGKPQVTDNRDTNIVYLYNADFLTGTYRIFESGTYIVMEDLVFNFNAPSQAEVDSEMFSPNSVDVDELYWYPSTAQAAVDGPYPGLYRYEGPYSLGFFAGISVETDYVVIDLNGYTLSQDETFYFQQRFFALIELASMPFIPGQGPSNWGPVITSASHVDIINGELGLTSHHGVHGNNNFYINIDNVNAGNFDVAGMQCNACNHVSITNCVIGPQNQNIPVLGRYAHARAFVPRLKQLMTEHGDEFVTFDEREPVLVSSLVDRLIAQMDMIYHHFINDAQYDDDDDEWIAAKTLFLNPTGWMDGGTSYGVVIGGAGAQVVGIGSRSQGTSDVTLDNLEIFGVGNKLIEKIKFADGDGATRLMFFDAIDWMAVSDQLEDKTTSNYIGDAYTDCIFAVDAVVESWYYLNSLYITQYEEAYVFDGDNDAFVNNVFGTGNIRQPQIGGCGTDIQLHSSKGAIGLRIDGVQQLVASNIYIHDVVNWADLGSQEWCGAYTGLDVGGEDPEIQYGFSGTRSHGMVVDFAQGTLSNIQIANVESWNGEANGMTIYKGCELSVSNIVVDNIHAGTQLSALDVQQLALPNLVPRACGVDIRADTIVNVADADGDDADVVGIMNGDDISGFETCLDVLESRFETADLHAGNVEVVGKNSNGWSTWTWLSMILIVIVIVSLSVHHWSKLKDERKGDAMTMNEYKTLDDVQSMDNNSEYTPLL